jgi:putative redox protein
MTNWDNEKLKWFWLGARLLLYYSLTINSGKNTNMSLKDTIEQTQQAFRDKPKAAFATVKTSSTLTDRFRSEISIRHHDLVIDEPQSLGGTDSGPNPIEVLLAALGSCQEITYRAFATSMDIPLKKVSTRVEGDIDFRGFFGVDDSVRAGYQKIRIVVNIESTASDEQLAKLKHAVDSHCPVLDMLQNPVPVEASIVR